SMVPASSLFTRIAVPLRVHQRLLDLRQKPIEGASTTYTCLPLYHMIEGLRMPQSASGARRRAGLSLHILHRRVGQATGRVQGNEVVDRHAAFMERGMR